MTAIHRAAVIGAGTMGAGIASHLANAGVSVLLLDVAAGANGNRNAIADAAVARMLASSPPAFMHADNTRLITTGNIEDDIHRLSDVDWVAEAVIERLEVKQALYRAIDAARSPGTLVSSNTSTIPLSLLTHDMPGGLARDFCITHFFNPVRYMRLLEIVAGTQTRPEVIDTLAAFCDLSLGKGVVHCKDTPGFLANRVGVFALQAGLVEALAFGLGVEEADAVMGRPMGFPKTGLFGLYDLIGLDLMLDVVNSLVTALPADDPFHEVAGGVPLTRRLVGEGFTGDKGAGGFYRPAQSGSSSAQAVALDTGRYAPVRRCSLEAAHAGETRGLRALVEHPDRYGRFARRVLARTLAYAASLIPEVSDSPAPIDEAMRLGYGWTRGPFEMIDELGAGWFRECVRDEGLHVPPFLEELGDGPVYRARNGCLHAWTSRTGYQELRHAAGVIRLRDIERLTRPVIHNQAASVWDVGDGVACVAFHTKANALSPASMELLAQAVDVAERGFCALLIYNEAPHFSVGFDLGFVREAIRCSAWSRIDTALQAFQETCTALKYAPLPVVAAPAGTSLGGGFEVLLGCDVVQAHANTLLGLVETLVGLVPSGGGCKEMLHRWSAEDAGPEERLSGALRVFELIGMGKTAASPLDAAPHRFMLPRDRTTMNRDRLLAQSKARALELVAGYTAPRAPEFTALGGRGRDAMHAVLERLEATKIAGPHDVVVGRHLAWMLCGGDAPEGAVLRETDMLALERAAFVALAETRATAARIEYMLDHGRQLRN